MQPAPTRYVQLEDNKIVVTVGTPTQMKEAIKELKHKKREFQHHRRGLMRQRKAAEARVKEREGPARGRAARGTKGWFATIVNKVWPAAPVRALSQVESDLELTDDILHTIDAHIVELEGRLLRAG